MVVGGGGGGTNASLHIGIVGIIFIFISAYYELKQRDKKKKKALA